ncbi:MAG: copper amine oxidase N-terminal domain-containing protein [Clostridiales bacterium]|nr:copper amine oxidase N-terminal domain-containing protein [Clostridiales bacterium]
MKRITGILIALMCAVQIGVHAEESYSDALFRITRDNYSASFFSRLVISTGSQIIKKDSAEENLKNEAVLKDGTTFVPAAAYCAYFGADLEKEENGYVLTQGDLTARISTDLNSISLVYGKGTAEEIILPASAYETAGELYLPVRVLTEQVFASNVAWDGENNRVIITRPYQTKRIIVKTEDGAALPEGMDCKEIITNGKGTWILQFDMSVSDKTVSECAGRLEETTGIKYAEPDVIASAA